MASFLDIFKADLILRKQDIAFTRALFKLFYQSNYLKLSWDEFIFKYLRDNVLI